MMNKKLLKHSALCTVIAAVCALFSGAVSAQSGPRLLLGEIADTARKQDKSRMVNLVEAQIRDSGLLTLGTDVSYSDERVTDLPIGWIDSSQNARKSDSRFNWNDMLSFRSADNRWRVALERKNLADERVLKYSFDIGIVATGGYNPPRTWAISVGYTY